MPTVYKVLGQSAPAANTNSDMYTVPAANSAVCSTLAICNRGVSTAFRVAIRPGNASIANSQYLCFDTAVNANDSLFLTLGVTLAATDVVTVSANTANVTFSLFGSEIF